MTTSAIKPSDIDTSKHFWDAFGRTDTEVSARSRFAWHPLHGDARASVLLRVPGLVGARQPLQALHGRRPLHAGDEPRDRAGSRVGAARSRSSKPRAPGTPLVNKRKPTAMPASVIAEVEGITIAEVCKYGY